MSSQVTLKAGSCILVDDGLLDDPRLRSGAEGRGDHDGPRRQRGRGGAAGGGCRTGAALAGWDPSSGRLDWRVAACEEVAEGEKDGSGTWLKGRCPEGSPTPASACRAAPPPLPLPLPLPPAGAEPQERLLRTSQGIPAHLIADELQHLCEHTERGNFYCPKRLV